MRLTILLFAFVSLAWAQIVAVAVAATVLADAGYRDSTNAPNDISGTARDATPTIGAWELAAAGPTVIGPFPTHFR
jgi:hypothetical protein